MSTGNTKTKGNKGNNFPFQHKVLLAMKDLLASSGGPQPPGGWATESTLNSVLNSILATQDIEILLVRDTGNSDQVVQQIREYDQGTGTWITRYEDVSGAAYVPVGPLEYLDPSAVLNLMLSELLALNAGGPLLTEATFAAEDFATELTLAGIKTQTDLFNFLGTALEVNVTSSVLPTGAATEATLNLVDSSLAAINTDIQLTNIELGNILSAFNAEDFAQEATLAAFSAKLNTLGQKLSSASTPVVLSTEQQVILDAIKTAVENLDLDVDGLATETTLEAIRVLTVGIDNVLDAIKADTGNMLTSLATEATLLDVETAIDAVKSDTGAMVIDLAAIEANTQPALLQSCGHIDLSNTTGIFGNGSKSFTIIIESGTASIGGLTKPAPYGVTFSADSNGTLGGIAYDATVDALAVVTAVRVQ